MAPVDVERVYDIFHLFAVSPGKGAAKEAYIPAYFLAIATREVGFYPTTSAVHKFITAVPTASSGEITFAAFLQFCEDVAHTNRPGRSGIYKLVDDLDTRGGGLISRRELFLILTNGSADISDGEIDAIMELLDPTLCGYVELKDLAALLIEACQHQRSLSRTSRSRSRHETPVQPITALSVEDAAEKQTPPPQQPQPDCRRHHHHHRERQHHSSHSRSPHRAADAPPSPPPPQHQQQEGGKGNAASENRPAAANAPAPRRVRRFAASNRCRNSGAGQDAQEPSPQPPTQQQPSSSPAGAVGGDERDRSFKRTDIGSNGEVAYRKYGSLYRRAETFERNQSAATVDVDCPLSVNGTATRHKASEEARTPSPLSRRPHAAAGMSSPQSSPPKGPAAPLPLGPSSPGATPPAASPPKAAAATGPGSAVSSTNEPRQGATSPVAAKKAADLVTVKDGEEETNYYSRVEGTTTVQPTWTEPPQQQHLSESPVDAPHSPPEGVTPATPSNPSRTKTTKTKCCTMF
jgi:Ca2+-binding EF-hand superfamily protein